MLAEMYDAWEEKQVTQKEGTKSISFYGFNSLILSSPQPDEQ